MGTLALMRMQRLDVETGNKESMHRQVHIDMLSLWGDRQGSANSRMSVSLGIATTATKGITRPGYMAWLLLGRAH